MIKRLNFLTPVIVVLALVSQNSVMATPTDSLQLRSGWYGGIEGGVPFAASTFSSFGYDKTRAGYNVGLYGGYSFNTVLSAELSLKWGKTSLSSNDCCVNSGYWLGADGVRYFAPVINMEGWDYADLKSSVSLQQYGARLNVNILGFFDRTKSSRWTFDVSPALYAVGTKATIKTIAENTNVFEHGTKWHLGYGGRVQAGYRITRKIGVGIYSEITALTGKNIDGMPEYRHNSNLIWESGVRIGWTFGKEKGKNRKVKAECVELTVLPLVPGREVCTEEPLQEQQIATVATEPGQEVSTVTPAVSETPTEAVAPTFPDVYFAFNSYCISQSEDSKLQTILTLLKEHPDMKVTLNGWCDTKGSVNVNKRISFQRAEAVKTWLVNRGIDANRITTVGNGSEYNEPDASKARRVSTQHTGVVTIVNQ